MKKLFLIAILVMEAFVADAQSFVWFRNPDEVFNEKLFKVVHIWSDKFALAYGKGDARRTSKNYNGQLVLLAAAEGHVFYDDQIIEVKRGWVPMVIGVYRFEFDKKKKSIPVLSIREKDNRTKRQTDRKKEKPRDIKGLLID